MPEFVYRAEIADPSQTDRITQAIEETLDDLEIDYRSVNSEVSIGYDPHENRLGGFHRDDPETSRQAALDNYPRSGTQRESCLHYVVFAGSRGATFEEIQNELEMFSAAKRLTELSQGRWVADSDRRRKTSRGSDAVVYIATDRARRYVEDRVGSHALGAI